MRKWLGKDVILSWLGEVQFESEELSLLIVDGEQRSGHTLGLTGGGVG